MCRPNNMILGRMFDHHMLDMIELGKLLLLHSFRSFDPWVPGYRTYILPVFCLYKTYLYWYAPIRYGICVVPVPNLPYHTDSVFAVWGYVHYRIIRGYHSLPAASNRYSTTSLHHSVPIYPLSFLAYSTFYADSVSSL
jgi:hypothetical protein